MSVILYLSIFILIQWLTPWWTLAPLVAGFAFLRVEHRSFFRTAIESLSVPLIAHLITVLLADTRAEGRISQSLAALFQTNDSGPLLLTLGVTFVLSLLSFLTGATLRRAIS